MKTRSLFSQLLFTFIPIIILGLLTLSIIINQTSKKFYYFHRINDLREKTSIIKNLIDKDKFQKTHIQNLIDNLSNNTRTRITIIDNSGIVIADSDKNADEMDNHFQRPEIISANNSIEGSSTRYSRTLKINLLYYAVKEKYRNNINYFIRVSVAEDEIQKTISILQNTTLIISTGAALSLILLSYFFSKKLIKPLDSIRKQTEEYVSTLSLPKPIEIPKTKELASLAVSLNKMSRKMDKRIRLIQLEKEDKESLLSSIQEGIIAIDNHKRIISINDIALRFLSIKKFKNRSFDQVIKRKRFKKFINNSFDQRENIKNIIQKELIIKENKKRYFLVNASPLIRSGSVAGLLVTIKDITLQKQLEKVRQDFVANVSHELKTPITSILGYLEILNNGNITKNEKNLFLNTILKQTNRMNSTIDDLLKLSKIESQEDDENFDLSIQNLYPILKSAADDLENYSTQHNKNIIIECKLDIFVYADYALLTEALINLIENAIKYGNPNTDIYINVYEKKKHLFINVENIGNPIPKKHHKRIFQRFYRIDKSRDRKAGGTGLGLAIVKHIIIVHGGDISVFSDNGKNCFSIKIPIAKNFDI